jgi:hypothetical protein
MDKRLIWKTVGTAVAAGVIFAVTPLYDDATDFMRGALGMPRRTAEQITTTSSAGPAPAMQPSGPNYAADQPDQLEARSLVSQPDPATIAALRKLSLRQLLLLSTIAGEGPVERIPSVQPSTYPGTDPSLAMLQRMSPSTSSMGLARRKEPRSIFAGVGSVDPNVGAIDEATGQFLAPAGPGAYVDPRNGALYSPAGPDGVVNTRTGEYSPVSH